MNVAMVTGAGSGIGRAIALRLAAEGFRVAVNDFRLEVAQAVAAEIGSGAIAVGGDVSVEGEVALMVGACVTAFGPVTHLVNNAGHVHQCRFVDLTPADFDRMIAVHLRGAFLCTHAVLRGMLAAWADRRDRAGALFGSQGGDHRNDQGAGARSVGAGRAGQRSGAGAD